jgi:type II secretory ATPase GspE/PulE/Tfp pilus assembly ATPase PilB-like protein
VVKLVDLIIRQAIDEHASDIHIEPFKDKISLRYRIDGKLYEIPPPTKYLHLPIISRIKILSKLDIAEKRLPQDGAFLVRMEDRTIDLRVSTIPTIYGEKVVLRILDRSAIVLNIDQLGFDAKQVEQIRKVIKSPYGLVFLTGPTGSGKTTTLYAILNEVKGPTKNIITIEDPVEYKLDGVNQVQVKPEIGLTFANALKSILRHDPDVMMIGEVRDLETAELAIRTALTGHLIFSTLHTNDACSGATRLIDIGIEPYLVASSVNAFISQRLIRVICPDCKTERKDYKGLPEYFKNVNIYYGKGCDKCKSIGYRGMTAIYEILTIDEAIEDLILKKSSVAQIKKLATERGFKSLLDAGIERVKAGVTTPEEVMRVAELEI